MACPICCENFNKSSRVPLSCPYCTQASCSSCTERYLLETTEDAHCMNCRKGWSREILVANFSQKFVSKTYKKRREELLFEREKSLMPATQPYVEVEKEIRRLQFEIEGLKQILEQFRNSASRTMTLPLGVLAVEKGLETEFDALLLRGRLVQEHRKDASKTELEIQYLEWCQQRWNQKLHGGAEDIEKRKFVRACPYPECRGFLSTAWKCGLCENWTCHECHEGKGPDRDAEHVCKPENVATAQLLAKDSRNCPNCAAMIFKIDGCDQMYCVKCHTAFSWRTGRVETGVIHNPHYYEYHRTRGTLQRNPGDVPCGGMPDWNSIAAFVPRTSELRPVVSAAHRSYGHCQWIILPRYAVNINDDNRDLRIKLMIGDMDEDDFKRKIQQREKARQRKTDIRQVLEMYMAVLTDLFQNLVGTRHLVEFVESLTQLRLHVNNTLLNVSNRYSKCAIPEIGPSFDLH